MAVVSMSWRRNRQSFVVEPGDLGLRVIENLPQFCCSCPPVGERAPAQYSGGIGLISSTRPWRMVEIVARLAGLIGSVSNPHDLAYRCSRDAPAHRPQSTAKNTKQPQGGHPQKEVVLTLLPF